MSVKHVRSSESFGMLAAKLSIFVFCLSSVQTARALQIGTNQTMCPTCVLVKSSFNTENVFPWLFNNNRAR